MQKQCFVGLIASLVFLGSGMDSNAQVREGAWTPETDSMDRGYSSISYWTNRADGVEIGGGRISVEHGKPAWKAELDAPEAFDAATVGKLWRLGNNKWTTLDTNLPLRFGVRRIDPGIYYLILERPTPDSWQLAFVDPAAVRPKLIDAWGTQARPKEIPILFTVPLAYSKGEKKAELDITLSLDDADMAKGWLRIRVGTPSTRDSVVRRDGAALVLQNGEVKRRMTRLKVGVCQCPPELLPGSRDWQELCRAVQRESPALFLLNEMPFGRWIASGPSFDASVWRDACSVHDQGMDRISELGAPVVAGTRAREVDGRRVNEAFVWTRERGAAGVHTKQYFPDEEGFYEARWFEPGERHFRVAEAGAVKGGFLICTEVMFNERARHYGRGGAEVLFVPRAAGRASLPRWKVAMQMAAIVSGCYVLSSNRGGTDARGQVFGGSGWVVSPDGEALAQTSETTPVVFHEIDTEAVARAQKDYPCYVKE